MVGRAHRRRPDPLERLDHRAQARGRDPARAAVGRPRPVGAHELPRLRAEDRGGRIRGRVDAHAGVVGQPLAGDVEHERAQAQVLVLGA